MLELRGVLLLSTLTACGGGKDVLQPGTNEPPSSLTEAGVRECGSPLARETDGPYEARSSTVPAPELRPWIWHGGISAVDLTTDGVLDVLVSTEFGLYLYQGTGDGYYDEDKETFGGFDLTFASGAMPSDYDGDGDLDIYVTRVAGFPAPEWTAENEVGRNRLLRNDGGLVFTDVTDEAGVDACGIHHRTGELGCFRSMAASWGDVDADGDLDLYVGNYGFVDETDGTQQEDMDPAEPDFLYLNDGDGTFTDVSDRLPLEFHDGYTYAGGLFDLDDDGDLDLYNVNDFGNNWPNTPLWNNGSGTFATDADQGFQSGLLYQTTGMGLGIGDLNGDQRMDLFMPVWQHNVLFESRSAEGQAYWVDVSQNRGVADPMLPEQDVPWGTELGDLDNDGDLDAAVQYGYVLNENSLWVNSPKQPDALYINTSAGPDYQLVDEAAAWGVADPGMSRGVVLADLNDDGWLDIGKRMLNDDSNDGVSRVSRNALYLSRCGDAGWLKIKLRQPDTMNTFAVGAKVLLTANGQTQTRWLSMGGTGYASSPPPDLHFGLGDVDVVDEIVVRWPDGQTSTFGPIDARQEITISR